MRLEKKKTTATLIIAIFILSTLAIAIPIASAATILVPDDYTTIQAAIDNANPDDTIIVAADTYTENLVIDVTGLTLESAAGAATTTIQSDAGGIPVSIMADGVTVEGFTVTGCDSDEPYGEQGAGIYLEAVDYCTIKDNILTDNYGVGINLYGGAYGAVVLEYPDYNLVTGNVITGWRHETLGGGTSHGIKVKGSHNTISDNEISVANNVGILIWSQEGAAETLAPCDNVISGNNIFDVFDPTDHHRQMMAGIMVNSGHFNEIRENTIGDYVQAGIVLKDPGTWTFTASHDNVISGNTITAGVDEGGWFGHKGIVLIGLIDPLYDNCIIGNTITGKAVGLYFQNSPDNPVHYNKIDGNLVYGVESDTATLDATYNWWGDPTGPSGAGSGSGDAVSTLVDFAPWLELEPGAAVGMTVLVEQYIPPVISISVDPTFVDFGTIIEGGSSTEEFVQITNKGNVAVDVTYSIVEEVVFYAEYLHVSGVPSNNLLSTESVTAGSTVEVDPNTVVVC